MVPPTVQKLPSLSNAKPPLPLVLATMLAAGVPELPKLPDEKPRMGPLPPVALPTQSLLLVATGAKVSVADVVPLAQKSMAGERLTLRAMGSALGMRILAIWTGPAGMLTAMPVVALTSLAPLRIRSTLRLPVMPLSPRVTLAVPLVAQVAALEVESELQEEKQTQAQRQQKNPLMAHPFGQKPVRCEGTLRGGHVKLEGEKRRSYGAMALLQVMSGVQMPLWQRFLPSALQGRPSGAGTGLQMPPSPQW